MRVQPEPSGMVANDSTSEVSLIAEKPFALSFFKKPFTKGSPEKEGLERAAS